MSRPRFTATAFVLIVGLSNCAGADKFTEMPEPLKGYDPSGLIHITTLAEARAVRKKVIDYIWASGFPADKLPAAVTKYTAGASVAWPNDLKGIDPKLAAKAERLDVHVDLGFHHYSYWIEPIEPADPPRLAIVHQGHGGGLDDGVADAANLLLDRGWIVVAMQMPLVGWNEDHTFTLPDGKVVTVELQGTRAHNWMFDVLEGKTEGVSTLRFFLEPVAAVVNRFVKLHGADRPIMMTGLSGGGWITHLAAAIDPRITLSIPVAGSEPLYVRRLAKHPAGDVEQLLPALYEERASWLDLYILGAGGKGRRQIMVLNQFDSCCFYGVTYKTYVDHVQQAVGRLGTGRWDFHLDTTHRGHIISPNVLEKIIAPALGG